MTIINVLDHGFVKLRNIAGPTRRLDTVFDASDVDVANAARMSFEASDQDRSYDVEMKLNRYLLKHQHMTPFESIVVWLEMKMPIFVARQFVRHRTQSINEVSGRYVTLPSQWYIPAAIGGKAKDKKQGQEDNLPREIQSLVREVKQNHAECGYAIYLKFLEYGVAPEHARLVLGLNHYTHWLTTMNLRNLMHFLSLREEVHAQIEAQAYASAIIQLLEPHIPGLVGLYKELVRVN